MDKWKAEQGRGREKRKIRREKIREEKESEERRCRRAKRYKSRDTVFFQWFVAPEGRKVSSLKRRVRSQLARWEMKNVRRCGVKHISKSNVQNTWVLEQFWKLRCRKSARRCGAKHISKSTCAKHLSVGATIAQERLRANKRERWRNRSRWLQHKQRTNSQLSQVTYKPTSSTRPHELPQHPTNLPTMMNRLMTTNLNRTRARQHRIRSPSLETRLRVWFNARWTHASDKQRTCWKTVGLAWKSASLGHRFGRRLVRRRQYKLPPNQLLLRVGEATVASAARTHESSSKSKVVHRGCRWHGRRMGMFLQRSLRLRCSSSHRSGWSSRWDHPIKKATLALGQMDLGSEGPGRSLRCPSPSWTSNCWWCKGGTRCLVGHPWTGTTSLQTGRTGVDNMERHAMSLADGGIWRIGSGLGRGTDLGWCGCQLEVVRTP